MKNSSAHALALCVALSLAAGQVFAQSTPAKFSAFWVKFKTAVANDDAATVADLTKLPFSVDNKALDRAAYIKQYRKLFGNIKSCIVKGKPIKDQTDYTLFCGEQGIMFAEVDGEYKFTEFFAND